MKIGVDASNIITGGGLTHLRELLEALSAYQNRFREIHIWACENTLAQLSDKEWLKKHSNPWLEKNLLARLVWQYLYFKKLLRQNKIDILLLPGSTSAHGFHPNISISQNLLPFVAKEVNRHKITEWQYWRMKILRITQASSFLHADATIFLTDYAKDIVLKVMHRKLNRPTVIPHGLNKAFIENTIERESQKPFSSLNPCKILYVSTIYHYKHQCELAQAVIKLRTKQLFISLDFIGEAHHESLEKLNKYMNNKSYINYLGPIQHDKISDYYDKADIFAFVSSCETFGQILLEAMARKTPIVCSNVSPMPEILQEAGLYCNPESPDSIANALECYYHSHTLRLEKATKAFAIAQSFSWDSVARKTLELIESLYADTR